MSRKNTVKLTLYINKMRHLHQLTRQQFLNKIYNYKQHPHEFIYCGELPGVVIISSTDSNFCVELEPAFEIMAKKHKNHYNIYYVDTIAEPEIITALKLNPSGLPVIYLCPVKSTPTIISDTIDIRKITNMADKLFAAVQKVD